MADTEKVIDINLTSSSELTASLLEQLGKAFVELEAQKVTSTNKVQWNDIEQHFRDLELIIKKKLEELEVKEKVLAERESHNRAILAEREAAVIAKEQEMLDKVQELKDAAADVIAEARANYNPESLEQAKVSSSIDNENATVDDDPEGKSLTKTGANAEGTCAKLTQFCEQMDSKGLLKFVTENLKTKTLSDVCKEQLSVALGSATDPARLVLNALEGFFPSPNEQGYNNNNEDAAISGMRRSCLLVMEALSTFLAKADSSAADSFLNPENKHLAVSIANEWKPKLAVDESSDSAAANGFSLEAEGFLRLVSTFRIASEFEEEELCKYVLAVAHHRQATELCRSLELTQKIPGLVDALIGSGRQIDAVHFIHAFNLSETYPTVPLLKSFLKELRRSCQGTGNAALQNGYNARELAALRGVIECVEEYKLEDSYPIDPLQRRVAQLDKSAKFDKKRSNETLKDLEDPKKPRTSTGSGRGGFSGPPRPRGGGRGRRGPPTARQRAPLPYTGLTTAYGSYGSSYAAVSSQSPYGLPPTHQSGKPGDSYTAAAAPSYAGYNQASHYPYL